MPTIIVDVMPKAELLDPQGKAVAGALARLGKSRIKGVRVGKRFELEVDEPIDASVLEEVRLISEDLLSNQVIEDVVDIRVGDSVVAGETH